MTLDQYIKKATRGLPRKDRIDAAAELRAHLIEKIKELMQQGFSREEATYLAVQEMGSPQLPLAQRIRHFAQHHLPYWVLGVLLLGTAVWWGKDNLFAPRAGIHPLEDLGLQELKAVVGRGVQSQSGWQAVKVVYPPETKYITMSIVGGDETGDGISTSSGSLPVPGKQGRPNNFRATSTFLLGVQRLPEKWCQGLSLITLHVHEGGEGSSGLCLGAHPEDRGVLFRGWDVHSPFLGRREIKLDTWIPLAEIYVPERKACSPSCPTSPINTLEERVRHPEHWQLLMIYASTNTHRPDPVVAWNVSRSQWDITSRPRLRASE
ncbi:permease prefix domain 1-containing protein [Deinococcus cellulosilyticus]|uniref:Uncharacterized protein n=1 Tax=Deinococcus cellulosilyticus (strain DSM 18568 / NBRC 106333 / KACC 11606 / 5516J-15) TaxID=1223518 RepID=A0A511N1V7_DEIC1|nr:permease prefix domain 1-containing protein [Deinococcus cellulosilyticus]GEM46421.1 hypothetical protein DC3_20560 [Deinococcus cellulosilyticus NBRC 106333 = KACC 11606]